MAFVVIQHLAPDYKSLMVELLSKHTSMPVVRAEQDIQIAPDHVYLIPPRFNLTLKGGRLQLQAPPPGKTLNLPIDIFFRSLATDCGDRAIAVILSGTGSDGARGIRSIKEAGGIVMVQNEASAKFAGMPSSAIATGVADCVLPVEEMAAKIIRLARHPFTFPEPAEPVRLQEDMSQINRICARLREVSGLDFSQYKPSTLCRRIERRMNISQLQDVAEYLRYLQQSQREAEILSKDLLISVTKFFRDPEAFEELERHVERIFQEASQRSGVRVWCAGCATGEEAYSLALLCERVRLRVRPDVDFKIFATDADRPALETAGSGIFPRSLLADMPSELLDRHFEPEGSDCYRINRSLRDKLIFARQDLMSDPPFTRIDLVSCRNLLIYLKPDAQRRILSIFHFALNPEGILFLGNSESLGELAHAFNTLGSKSRIYSKNPSVPLRLADSLSTLPDLRGLSAQDTPEPQRFASRGSRPSSLDRLQQHLLNRFAPATFVTNTQHILLHSLGSAGKYLEVATGPARLDLLRMVPRDLSLAITSASSQALREKRRVEFRSVRFEPATGPSELLTVGVEPFEPLADNGPLLIITLQAEIPSDINSHTSEKFDVDSNLALRVTELERDLLSTRENLQSSIEQQETINEELQAANEELLAANEELQSTNEELESVNEELYTVNAEYQGKIQELIELNDDMSNFTSSTEVGTVFLDRDLCIRRFTPAFSKVTGLLPSDTGRQAATFGHPVMRAIVRASASVLSSRLSHEEVLRMPGTGEYLLRLQPYRQNHSGIEGVVAVLVDVSRLTDAEHELAATLETVDVGICVTDENGLFVQVNPAYCAIYGYGRDELIGQSFLKVVPRQDHAVAQQMHDDFIQTGSEIPRTWTVISRDGTRLRVAVRASLLRMTGGGRRKITVVSKAENAQTAP